MKKILILLSLLTTFNTFAASKLSCINMYSQADFIELDVKIDAWLIKNKDKSYELNNGEVNLELVYERKEDGTVDYNEDWHTETQPISHAKNNPNYRPVKYKNHIQFPDLAPVFGKLDLIIPPKVFESTESFVEFKAKLIMSWISDHFGTTATLKCFLRN